MLELFSVVKARYFGLLIASCAFLCTEFTASAQATYYGEKIRFGSVRSANINIRKGPSTEYPVVMKFTEYGVPVRIFNTVDNWTKIKDVDGKEGWVKSYVVSQKKRTCIIQTNRTRLCRLPVENMQNCEIVAYLAKRLILNVISCRNEWCRVKTGRSSGWVNKSDIWGVGMKETI